MIQVQAVDLGFPVNNMAKPQNQLFCRLDGLTTFARREQKLKTLSNLGLLVSEAVPIFEETTQKAATFSGAPISILGLVVEDELWFKSAVGLSTIGLTNQLAARRKIPLHESFSTYVIDSQQPLIIDNTLNNAVFADTVLAQHYGIKTYLGVPLISSSGVCIGTLEVMDWTERKFNDRDIDHLALLARWCLGEFERNQMLKTQPEGLINSWEHPPEWQKVNGLVLQSRHNLNMLSEKVLSSQLTLGHQAGIASANTASNPINIKLLSQLTQELKTPLTSVIGMASVLHREVYGPLTLKQREYLEIIHDSGQNLITLVDEIVSLGVLSDQSSEINLTTVDVEMLCQQVINSLKDLAKQHQQDLCLSVEPGSRICSLDKEKIRQALYYLIVSVLEMSEAGGEVKIHVSKRNQALNIAVGTSHPWLGDDFSEAKLHSQAVTQALRFNQGNSNNHFNLGVNEISPNNYQLLTSSALMMVVDDDRTLDQNTNKIPRDLLGLLLCCYLAELHEGRVIVQGSANSSYRYLLQFPQAKSAEI
ncbi:MAG: histidine kinase dimerization/phospho-acceptor domain-containing protein [Pleurocapsa sp.]